MRWESQSRVGRIERRGDAPPREMIAQWHASAMDRMRLIDRPEERSSLCKLRGFPRKREDAQFINYPNPTHFPPMRERQAVQSILTRALLQARESHASRIKTLWIAIGEISELDLNAIQQHWEELSQGTAAEQARLQFRFIQAEVQCMACFNKYHPLERKIHCPYCGSYGAKVLTGEEFHLESLELGS